jgi:hypothetical protein
MPDPARRTAFPKNNLLESTTLPPTRGLRERRLRYAEELIARADTVTLLTCEEVTAVRERAMAGEFDGDLA